MAPAKVQWRVDLCAGGGRMGVKYSSSKNGCLSLESCPVKTAYCIYATGKGRYPGHNTGPPAFCHSAITVFNAKNSKLTAVLHNAAFSVYLQHRC